MHRLDCPTEQQLSAFHLGDLPDDTLDAVAEHVDECPTCETALRRLEAVADHVLAALRCGPVEPRDETLVTADTPMADSSKRSAGQLLAAEICPPGYELLSVLGEGGIGIVYQARHRQLNRLVALKMLQRQTPAALARFRTEAEAVARLRHPHIIQIYEVGEHQGRAFLVLEFVDGGSLAQRLAATPQPARDSAVLVQTLAQAIHHAHTNGVIHRDLKPANVLLTSSGDVKVSDFGLAKQLDGDALHTQSGDLVGTPSYMAPEQAGGRFREVGPAADVYALGAILYELLTGRPPFRANTHLDTLMLVMNAEAPSVTHLQPRAPRDLSIIAMKCLEKAPGKRYASAQALADDLGRFLDGRPIQARAVSRVERARRWATRNPIVAGLTTGLFVVLLAGIVGVSWKWWEAEVRRQEADNERIVADGERKKAVNEKLNADIERGKADEAHVQIAAAQRETIKERNDAVELSAGMRLDKGIDLAERGEVSAGLFWMLEAARTAPEGATDLRRAARLNFAVWLGYTPGLRHYAVLPPSTHSLAYRADGKRLAFCTDNDALHWQATTDVFQPIRWKAPKAGRDMALSPNGQWVLTVASQENDQTLTQCWELGTGRRVGEGIPGPPCKPVFRPDGAVFAVAETAGIRICDSATGKMVQQLSLEGNPVITCIAFSPNGEKLVVATGKPNQLQLATARIWDLDRGQPVGEPLTHRGAINSASFSPDGASIVTGSLDCTAQRWDAGTGTPMGAPLPTAHGVDLVGYTPDGATITTIDQFAGLLCWDAHSGQRLISTLPRTSFAAPWISADGKQVVVAPAPGFLPSSKKELSTIEYWQVGRGDFGPSFVRMGLQKQKPLGSGASRVSITLSPDGNAALVINADGQVRVIDTASGKPRGQAIPETWRVMCADFSPDSKRVALVRSTRPDALSTHFGVFQCDVLDAATGQSICPRFPINYVTALAFSPDGKLLLTASGGVAVYDADTGKRVGKTMLHPEVRQFAITPDGQKVVIAHRDQTRRGLLNVVVWDLASRTRQENPFEVRRETGFHLSPDSKLVLTLQTIGGECRLWDLATGKPTGVTFQIESFRGAHARFSRDGQTLLIGNSKGTRLLDPATGKPLGKPMDHPSEVTHLAISADPAGKYLLVGCLDGSFRLWDRATCRPIGPSICHQAELRACAFTADGRSFVTASEEGSIRLWPLPALPSSEAPDFDRLRLRLEVRTGLTLRESGSIEPIERNAWMKLQKRLLELEGSVESAYLELDRPKN